MVGIALIVIPAFILNEPRSHCHPEPVVWAKDPCSSLFPSHCHPEPVLWAKDPCSSLFPVRRDKLPRSFGPKEPGLRMTGRYVRGFFFEGVAPTSHFMSATVKKPEQARDWTR
jgi:hypothetical protein